MSARTQNPGTANAPAPPLPKPQFFAGIVAELDQTHIKVSRTLVGRPTESRTFLVDANTKINKNSVKVRSRVTVRFRRLPEGDLALEIQLRPQVRSPKSP